MYCLSQFCYCCLKKRKQYININYRDIDNISYKDKFRFCYLRIDVPDEIPKVLCLKCCKSIDEAYTFRKMYLRRRQMLKGYVVLLKQTNNDFTNTLSSLSVNVLNADEFLFQKQENYELDEISSNIIEDSLEIKSEPDETITNEDVQGVEDLFDIDVKTVNFTLNNPFVLQKEEHQEESNQTDESLNNYEIVNKEEKEETGNENGDLLRVVRKDEDSGLKIVIRKSSRDDYKCSSCDDIFPSVTELNTHLLSHETKTTYNCLFCSDSFPNERFLYKHERIHPNRPNKPYKCTICQKTIKHKMTYRIHMSLHTGNYIYKCNICKKGLASKHNLNKHTLTHFKPKNTNHNHKDTSNHDENTSNHDENTANHNGNTSNHDDDNNTNKLSTPVKLNNDQCKAKITHNLDEYQRTLSMINKLSRRRGRPRKSPKKPPEIPPELKKKPGRPAVIKHCKICNLNFPNRQVFDRHVGKYHTPHECQLCHRRFKTTSLLKMHRKLNLNCKHNSAPKFDSFKCEICHKGFRFNIQLKHHLKTHADDTDEEEVTDVQNGEHFLAYTSPKQTKPTKKRRSNLNVKCAFCNKKFVNKVLLDIHELVHTGVYRFHCSLCPSRFFTNVQLESHVSRTHKNTIFSCKYCYKPFKLRQNLNKHIIIYHVDEVVKYQCNFCEKSFLKRSILHKHVKQHTALERRYKCSECNKDFRAKAGLIRHLVTHTNEMAYQCTICNRRFNLETSLQKHQMSKFCKKPLNV